MSRSNASWRWSNNSVWIWNMMVDKTGKVHKISRLQMLFRKGVLKNFAIFIKFSKNSFFIEDLRWLLLGTAINLGYYEKYLLQNSKDKLLHNSISVNMKVYALQLKKIYPVFYKKFYKIIEQLLSIVIFGGWFWKQNKTKQKQNRGG